MINPRRGRGVRGAARRGLERRGGAIVETAVVLPIVLAMMLGVMEYGRYLAARQVVENAVREGSRYAVVRTVDETTLDSQIRDQVHQKMAGFHTMFTGYDKNTSIQVYESDASGNNVGSWKDAAFAEYITVRVTAVYKPVVPHMWVPFLGNTMTILQQHPIDFRSVMYSEAN
jgi:Flp pilus assembly protein TadG